MRTILDDVVALSDDAWMLWVKLLGPSDNDRVPEPVRSEQAVEVILASPEDDYTETTFRLRDLRALVEMLHEALTVAMSRPDPDRPEGGMMMYPEPTEEREYIKVLSDHTTLVVDLVTRHRRNQTGEPYIERFGFLMAEFRNSADADAFIKANRREQMS